MSIGIRNIFVLAADQVVTSSVTPVAATGLTIPIGAGQTLVVRFHATIGVGATGGIRFQITVPAGGTLFRNAILLSNTVIPLSSPFIQSASAAFTNALASSGTHYVDMDCTIVNGATAGNVAITFAQNTSDALSLTLARGSYMATVAI